MKYGGIFCALRKNTSRKKSGRLLPETKLLTISQLICLFLILGLKSLNEHLVWCMAKLVPDRLSSEMILKAERPGINNVIIFLHWDTQATCFFISQRKNYGFTSFFTVNNDYYRLGEV